MRRVVCLILMLSILVQFMGWADPLIGRAVHGGTDFIEHAGIVAAILFTGVLAPLFLVMETWSETRQFLFGRVPGIAPVLPVANTTKMTSTNHLTMDSAISALSAPDVLATEDALLQAGFSHNDLLRVADMMLSTRDIGKYMGMFMPSVQAEKIAARVLSVLRPQVMVPALDTEGHDNLVSSLLTAGVPLHIDTPRD